MGEAPKGWVLFCAVLGLAFRAVVCQGRGMDVLISQLVKLHFAGCVEAGDVASVGTLIQGPSVSGQAREEVVRTQIPSVFGATAVSLRLNLLPRRCPCALHLSRCFQVTLKWCQKSSAFCFWTGWGFSMGTHYHYHSWRVFVIVCALPCTVSMVALRFMPESPRFLLEVSQHTAVQVRAGGRQQGLALPPHPFASPSLLLPRCKHLPCRRTWPVAKSGSVAVWDGGMSWLRGLPEFRVLGAHRALSGERGGARGCFQHPLSPEVPIVRL